MQQYISRTKILPPRQRPDLLSRPRLLDTLTDLLDYKLILLVAPAGYGKTYALLDLLRSVDMSRCWYSVTAVDDDVTRFAAHFIGAMRHAFPTFGDESLAALQNYQPERDHIEQLVIPIVNDLYEHVGEHFVFVVDDYHLVDPNPDIGHFVSQFIQHVDANCHVILSSRTLLSLPDLPLLVARGLVAGLDYEDLAFQAGELQLLLLQNFGVSLAEDAAKSLVDDTDGWITGLMLSAKTQQWHMAGRLRKVRGSGIGLYDYLAQQVLDQLNPDLRRFLLRTSVMDEFDAELCTHVLSPEWLPAAFTWQDLIDEVEQKNLFVMPVGEHGTALRYHHLFQEFLRDRIRREMPADEHGILHRLIEAYAERGDWELAHATAKQLGDYAIVAGVIERAGPRMVRAGRFILVEQWLDGLPTAVVQSRPLLVLTRGYCLVQTGRVAEGLSMLSEAIIRLERTEAGLLSLARAVVYRSIANRLLGNYDDALRDAQNAYALVENIEDACCTEESQQRAGKLLLPQTEHARSLLEIRAFAIHNEGVCRQRMGQPLLGADLLSRALLDYELLADDQNLAMTSFELAVCYSDAGRHSDALRLFERVLAIWQEALNVAGQALVLNSIGVHHHEHGDYTRAFEALEESHACARRSGYTRLEAFALAGLGDIYTDLEIWQGAQDAYQQAYTIALRIDERFLILYLELARAVVASSIGEWDVAYECLDAAGQLVLDRNSRYEWGLYRMAMGRFYLAQNNGTAALEPLEDAGRCFVQGGHRLEAAKAHLYLASATHLAGDDPHAAERLSEAVRMMGELELRHSVIVTARTLGSALTAMARMEGADDRAAELLRDVALLEGQVSQLSRALRRKTALAPLEAKVGPPSIIVHALGRADVIVDGNAVPISQWKTKVSRDLFFCFLAFPEGLSKEQIGAMFWPDSSTQTLKTRFKNAIYRLRNAIGRDVVQFDDTVYFFDDSLDFEYDVEQFLGLLADVDGAEEPSDRLKLLQAAIDLYGGDYLPDVDGEWARMERERLRAIYFDAALTLAELCFEQGTFDDSLKVIQRLLAEDPCLEEGHRLAMRVHAAAGNRAAVARQYVLCQQALQEEIAAPPSPQTEQLYALLMR